MDNLPHSDKDALDSNLGGLLNQLLVTAITEFQQSTPTYQRINKRKLTNTLVSLVNFCYQCLQKNGSSRQFAVLSTLNKVI